MDNNIDIDKELQVEKWYFGIKKIFLEMQQKNKWSKNQAWDILERELIKKVQSDQFVPDDLDWVRDIVLYDKKPSTDEALRVAIRYRDSSPLIDCLASFV